MSLIADDSLTYYHRFLMNIVKAGQIPRHIAFIMDGNRRYAIKIKVDKTAGHQIGFGRLTEVILWSRQLGVKELTVYAFSIENFKRSANEVQVLMELIREKINRLMDERAKLMSNGVCIRIIGNLALLPADIRKSVANLMIMTNGNDAMVLNLAIAYTSRDEIAHSIGIIMDSVKSNKIDTGDVSEEMVSDCLYTSRSPDPDLLVRTSGEVRFSDFLLWQCRHTAVYFVDVLWPEFTIWHFLVLVLQYQRRCNSLEALRLKSKGRQSTKAQEFLKYLNSARLTQLESYK